MICPHLNKFEIMIRLTSLIPLMLIGFSYSSCKPEGDQKERELIQVHYLTGDLKTAQNWIGKTITSRNDLDSLEEVHGKLRLYDYKPLLVPTSCNDDDWNNKRFMVISTKSNLVFILENVIHSSFLEFPIYQVVCVSPIEVYSKDDLKYFLEGQDQLGILD